MTMQSILQQLTQPSNSDTVSRSDYEQWRRLFVFDALRGHRYGASFCSHFGIRDFRVQFTDNLADAERIIERDWLHSG